MELFGDSYKGQRRGEQSFRMEGDGRYVFANGDVYVGSFKDGQFHGKGILTFANGGGRFEGEWRNGVAFRGEYSFADGLAYREHDWGYATLADRRLAKELQKGIQASPC